MSLSFIAFRAEGTCAHSAGDGRTDRAVPDPAPESEARTRNKARAVLFSRFALRL